VTTGRAAAVAETHSAVVFFFGDRAYKVKKPVDLGFLDFRTVTARKAACDEEVRLNRRLAPDVYLGVADVVDPDGTTCDHLVVMQRMPADRRLATLVTDGADVDDALRAIAHQLATLHARSPRSALADTAAGIDATRARWVDNTEQLMALAGRDVFSDVAVGTVNGLAMRYLDGRAHLFAARVAAGRAVDGHGDLLADDIFCLPDGPRILDCLDFDARLRVGDGLADAAFLAMDLEHLGRSDLGRRFLLHYRELADDAWPPSLTHHHVAYRAQVRAKVTAVRAAQGDPHAAARARSFLELAEAHLDAGRIRLVVIGGLPGTGKSTLAVAVADALEATVLRTDEIRKELAGIPTTTSAAAAYGEGLYEHEATDRTYRTMLDRAAVALAHGESVVLDASWRDPRWRAEARALGQAAHADLTELRCQAPADVAAERLRSRAGRTHGRDASDATPEIAAAMSAEWESWPTATPIDTAGLLRYSLGAALAAAGLQAHPARQGGTRRRRSVPAG
jgi:aminoglycoside phosphotransferase family enzyme/predicted kinase